MQDSTPDPELEKALRKQSTELGNIKLRLEFTGSGSEYFRIWIVNLLLIIVTLGLYYPWAKVRRLRYFYSNTLLDGDSLDFHADPKKMAKGYLLVAALLGLVSLAQEVSASAHLIALLVLVGLWPALFKSSMQFRLANTSWRGLRFQFTGSLRGAYYAALPFFIPGVALFSLGLLAPTEGQENTVLGVIVLLLMLCSVGVLPWLFWNLKNHQHTNYAFGSLQTQFKATPGDFYKLSLKILGLFVAAFAVPGLCLWLLSSGQLKSAAGANAAGMALVSFALSLILMATIFAGLKPYAITRTQNLVWTQTGNRFLRFVSKLRFRSMLWLSVKNWLLILLTLGLYWPFAAVAMARMRLEAVCIKTRLDPNTLASTAATSDGDAAGEAAGDFFGFDIGL